MKTPEYQLFPKRIATIPSSLLHLLMAAKKQKFQ
jgi:hypothetical protein